MSNPSWVTSENVKFNGVFDNAVVLENTGGIKSLVLWDALSLADQQILIDLVNNYGGTTPLGGPTAGFQKLNFNGLGLGATATGLSATASATAGKVTIDLGASKAGSDPSGLSAFAGTSGSQVANFLPTIIGTTPTNLVPTAGYQNVTFSVTKVGGDPTNLVNNTAGYQIVDVGGAKVGSDPTGLMNDATVYTATITVDGVAKPISVVGSAAQTFTTLLSEINTDLGASAVADIVSGNIKVTSATTGVSSTVDIVDTNLFSTLTGYVAILSAVAGTITTYTTTITVDGIAKPISVIGGNAQTFTTLINEINTDLGASATAAIVGGNIKVTSATTGTTSTVLIVQGTLFAAPLANFSAITAAVPGLHTTAALTATIVVDGVSKPISVLPSAILTFADVINEINTDLGASAVASISGGDIVITSATFGVYSTVAITPGTLFVALPGFSNILVAQNGGSASRKYTASVLVDDTILKLVQFTGALGNTIQNVINEINTDLGASATAALTGGDIVITSATTGVNSKVSIQDTGFLFSSLTDYTSIVSLNGIAPTTYTATITVDGVAKPISVVGSAAQTFTTLINEINTDLGASATAALTTLVAGYQNTFFTTAKAGGNATGLANNATVYTATITVDGVAKPISVVGSTAQTFTTLINEINTDLGASATAALNTGDLRVTSASTGVTSTVNIVDSGTNHLFSTLTGFSVIRTPINGVGADIIVTSATTGVSSAVATIDNNLFKSLTLFKSFVASVPGAVNLHTVFKNSSSPNGSPFSEIFNVLFIGSKPAVPPTLSNTTKYDTNLYYTYFDGLVWRYLKTDSAV